jgi:hypothetical protein
VSITTKNSLAILKDDFKLTNQEEALEKAVAIVMSLRAAVGS